MDILFGVLLGLIQLGSAGLGIIVSLKKISKKKHKMLINAFVILGLVGISINVIVIVQNRNTQTALEARLKSIEQTDKQTEQNTSQLVKEKKEIRPFFEIYNPHIAPSTDKPNHYAIRIKTQNNGEDAAINLEDRIIFIDQEFKQPPIISAFAESNQVEPRGVINISGNVFEFKESGKPMYLVYMMKYYGLKTHKKYSQASYTKWNGIQGGIVSDFGNASKSDSIVIRQHLKSEMNDFLFK